MDGLNAVLNDESSYEESIGLFSDRGLVYFDDKNLETTVMSPESTEILQRFITFKDRESQELIDIAEGSAVITEKLSEELGVVPGDTIIFENSDEIRGELIVSGITENYLGSYIYIERTQYNKVFEADVKDNLILARTVSENTEEKDDLVSELLTTEGVMNAHFISQTRAAFDNLIKNIDYIVVVIIIASGMLAFIVLYNLTNININERKKELATLKVLGFHNEEVSGYIFREIGILTLIGILVGLYLGKLLHIFIILTVEDPDFMFGRNIEWKSYLISAVVTIGFSLLVNLVMTKKLRAIKMVESMKALD